MWQVVDKGSLNGSMLNSKPIGAPQSADASARQQGLPLSLAGGDILTIGTTSRIKVSVHTAGSARIPFGVAVVADPMAGRKGGKPLPMEDVPVYEWPLRGVEEVGRTAGMPACGARECREQGGELQSLLGAVRHLLCV